MYFNRKFLSALIVLFLMIAPTAHIFGQNGKKEKLQNQKKQIEKEISLTNRLLSQTRKSKKNTLNELVLLSKQIDQRELLIGTISAQVGLIDRQITTNKEIITKLEERLVKLKEEYKRLIYFAYKNRSAYDRWSYVFASEDFNVAYRRLKYIQMYTSYMKKQAELIVQTSEEITRINQELEAGKLEKLKLLNIQETEKSALARQENNKKNLVKNLKSKEASLKKKLNAKRAAAQRLNKQIKEIIAAEIAAANKKAGTTTSPSGVRKLTPEEALISKNFASNKGKLPWPSPTGIISSTFGPHKHPVLNITTQNNGIDIATTSGTKARAVFEGKVTAIVNMPHDTKAVIICHGEYYSVYSNLATVVVKRDQKISTKQDIGMVYTDPREGKTELHFEIWKNKTMMNPKPWLAGSK